MVIEAKKQRAEIVKARISKKESGKTGDGRRGNDQRINELKAKMPCRKCGKVGHWHRDCPDKQKGRQLVFSSFRPHTVLVHKRHCRECLVDTACAKTCMTFKYFTQLREEYRRAGIIIVEVEE